MSKSPEHKQKLYSQLNVCEKVRKVINSKGWTEILGPKLTKMIESVTGLKDDRGIYLRGMLDMEHGREDFYLGYKAGLMDFSNEVYNHIVAKNKITDTLSTWDATEEKAKTMTRPMEDTKYAGGEEA